MPFLRRRRRYLLIWGGLLISLLGCTTDGAQGPLQIDAETVALAAHQTPLGPASFLFIRHFHYYRRTDQATLFYSGDSTPNTLLDKVFLYLLPGDARLPRPLVELTNTYHPATQEIRASVSTAAPHSIPDGGTTQGPTFVVFNLANGPVWGIDFAADSSGFHQPQLVINRPVRLLDLSAGADLLLYVVAASRLYVAHLATAFPHPARLVRDFSPAFIVGIGWVMDSTKEALVALQRPETPNLFQVQRISTADGTTLADHLSGTFLQEIAEFTPAQRLLFEERIRHLSLRDWGMAEPEEVE